MIFWIYTTRVEFNTQIVSEKIQKNSGQEALSDDLHILIKIYVSGMVLIACEWILEDSEMTAEYLSELFEQSIPGPLRAYLMREVECNLRLVVNIAKKFTNRGLPLCALERYQVSCI